MAPAHDSTDFRPLAGSFPAVEEGQLVFRLPQRDVRVAGDLELARIVLSRCDGRHPIGDVLAAVSADDTEDARQLIAELSEAGVVVDCAEAWRLFHAQSSVGSGLGRPFDAEAVAALAAETFRPPEVADRLEPVTPAPTGVGAAAGPRRSAWAGETGRGPTFEDLSTVLTLMYGDGDGASGRPVPSGGALYPLAVHVVLRDPLGPLEAGLWWFDPAAGLRLVPGEPEAAPGLFVPEPNSGGLLARRNPIVFLSADLDRPSRKYANRGYRLALMEAGAAMQNAYLGCAELDLPVRAVAGIDDRRAHAYLALPGTAVALLALLLGT